MKEMEREKDDEINDLRQKLDKLETFSKEVEQKENISIA